jgi:hypothetical protein
VPVARTGRSGNRLRERLHGSLIRPAEIDPETDGITTGGGSLKARACRPGRDAARKSRPTISGRTRCCSGSPKRKRTERERNHRHDGNAHTPQLDTHRRSPFHPSYHFRPLGRPYSKHDHPFGASVDLRPQWLLPPSLGRRARWSPTPCVMSGRRPQGVVQILTTAPSEQERYSHALRLLRRVS